MTSRHGKAICIVGPLRGVTSGIVLQIIICNICDYSVPWGKLKPILNEGGSLHILDNQ